MKISRVDFIIFEDSTIKRLIVGIFAGLTLGMMLQIVPVVLAGSAYLPLVFFRGADCSCGSAGAMVEWVGVRWRG